MDISVAAPLGSCGTGVGHAYNSFRTVAHLVGQDVAVHKFDDHPSPSIHRHIYCSEQATTTTTITGLHKGKELACLLHVRPIHHVALAILELR